MPAPTAHCPTRRRPRCTRSGGRQAHILRLIGERDLQVMAGSMVRVRGGASSTRCLPVRLTGRPRGMSLVSWSGEAPVTFDARRAPRRSGQADARKEATCLTVRGWLGSILPQPKRCGNKLINILSAQICCLAASSCAGASPLQGPSSEGATAWPSQNRRQTAACRWCAMSVALPVGRAVTDTNRHLSRNPLLVLPGHSVRAQGNDVVLAKGPTRRSYAGVSRSEIRVPRRWRSPSRQAATGRCRWCRSDQYICDAAHQSPDGAVGADFGFERRRFGAGDRGRARHQLHRPTSSSSAPSQGRIPPGAHNASGVPAGRWPHATWNSLAEGATSHDARARTPSVLTPSRTGGQSQSDPHHSAGDVSDGRPARR